MRLQTNQPPFLGRLPGFFLLRVDVPRSRLTFWPWGEDVAWPLGGTGLGAQISASTLIFFGMKDSGFNWVITDFNLVAIG